MSHPTSRNHSRNNPMHLLAGLLATGLSVPALLGQSVPFPTYEVGGNQNGSQGPNYPVDLAEPMGRQQWPDHHPGRHSRLSWHYNSRQSPRIEP